MKNNETNLEENKILTFLLHEEQFGILVLSVKEIIELPLITRLPNTQNYILGVTNIRGNILPIIDLGQRLGYPINEKTKKTAVIIVEVIIEEGKIDIGILIDSVGAVYDLFEIHPVPDFGIRVAKEFILNMAKINNSFFTILNLETVLSIEDLSEGII